MSRSYLVTMKSGHTQAVTLNDEKSLIGLWIWTVNQASDRILSLYDVDSGGDVAFKSSDIAIIIEV